MTKQNDNYNLANMLSKAEKEIEKLKRERDVARREAEEFRDDMNIYLTEGDGKFTWESGHTLH
jgi:cell division protein FtsB|tara:strand:- start:4705 stop:4893 length:189 start_codon:yes stop_codon:yes gene_type:complete